MKEVPPVPSEIRLRRAERCLELRYGDGTSLTLPAEYLRVYSPSAEVKGHGDAPRKTVPGKKEVAIERVEPVGRYALKPVFSDGHDTGIFTWAYLYELGVDLEQNWRAYLEALAKEGLSRDPN